MHVIFTPLDLMIVPTRSSLLKNARSVRTVPVLLHALMLRDARVIEAVASVLE